MRLLRLALTLLCFGLIASAAEFQITGFGTGQKNPFNLADDLTGTWQGKGTLTSNALDLAGVSNVATSSNGIYSDLTLDGRAPVFIGSNTATLTLTGTLLSAPPGIDKFSISLFDTSGSFHELDYVFSWSQFNAGGPSGIAVQASLAASQGVFNGTVGSWSLNLFDATGTAPTTATANFYDLGTLTPLPEPSTGACLLFGLAALAIRRRRKRLAL